MTQNELENTSKAICLVEGEDDKNDCLMLADLQAAVDTIRDCNQRVRLFLTLMPDDLQKIPPERMNTLPSDPTCIAFDRSRLLTGALGFVESDGS